MTAPVSSSPLDILDAELRTKQEAAMNAFAAGQLAQLVSGEPDPMGHFARAATLLVQCEEIEGRIDSAINEALGRSYRLARPKASTRSASSASSPARSSR